LKQEDVLSSKAEKVYKLVDRGKESFEQEDLPCRTGHQLLGKENVKGIPSGQINLT
jgi:hypothetical protein